jgi:hypothetical protein
MKNLALRLCFVLPLAVFATFVLLIVIGIGTNLLGAGAGFYCTVYCKVGVGLFIVGLAAALYTQVRACMKESENGAPHIPA